MLLHHFLFALFAALVCINNGLAEEDEVYDYIVIGSGSAGAPLTNRLSADKDSTVLLLEKGPFYPDPKATVPALAPTMFDTFNADWYPVERQDTMGHGLIDKQQIWYKGKGLGGTSLLNYMAFTWAHPDYFDRWGLKCKGWSYSDVLPFFKDIEKSHIEGTKNIRGTKGELDVIISEIKYKAGQAFIQGCKEYGMKYLDDYNTQGFYGIGSIQANIRDGKRCDTGTAFLYDIADRPNLSIYVNSTATKLIINPKTKKVEAVEYIYKSQKKTVRVNREVVLSAGSIASPQLLMVSGIGPKEHLEELGIEVIEDLQVGQNIYDHIIYPGLFFPVNESISPQSSLSQDPNNWKAWFDGKGPLTVPSLALEAVGFAKTSVSNETIDYPDIEFLYMSGSFSTDFGTTLRREWRVSRESYNALWPEFEGKSVWSAFLMLLSPASKGYIRLKSPNLLDNPIIHANYLSDPENKDVKTLIAGIRMLQNISKMPSLAKYDSHMHLGALPGCENETVDSDQFWECQIRQIAAGVWHQTTSCKMGPRDDPEAVVDERLRVHGINNLRVADTSIFPESIVGHPSVASMMVGAYAAELILQDK